MNKLISITIVVLAACSGCDDDGTNAPEYITTVQLSAASMLFEWDDPDGDGGNPGTAQPVNLPTGTFTLTVKFLNRLETPEEDITPEVSDEGFQHQVFFTGTAVNGPATNNPSAPLTHSYADMDSNGLPLGLMNNIVATPGSGTLTVTLRHMPPEEPPMKSADSATQVKTGGFTAIGGSTDVQVDFAVTVQ